MYKTQVWRQFDILLFLCLIILVVLGVAMIYSANLDTEDRADLWRRQATNAIVGLALFFALSAIPYAWFRHVWWLGYLVALGSLILVLVLGESEIGNVRRWFYIGDFPLQPSFPSMLIHVVVMAAILDYRSKKERRLPMEGEEIQDRPGLRQYLFSGAAALVLAFLVFREPDLSTAVIFMIIWATVMFASDIRLSYLLATGVAGLVALIPLWGIMSDYQKERALLFINPSLDPGKLYNMHQALMSIGSGGIWGQGFAVGSQSQLHFLRVRHTDYVFSVVGEELGFIGTMLVLSLFTVLAWRSLRAALWAPDRFGRLLVVGMGAVVFFPLVVNVGMNTGVLPVTGLPLPFISYGGSALLTHMTALGVIQSVVMRHQVK